MLEPQSGQDIQWRADIQHEVGFGHFQNQILWRHAQALNLVQHDIREIQPGQIVHGDIDRHPQCQASVAPALGLL